MTSRLFPDPIAAARNLQQRIWDQYRVRSRIGLAPNKWMAKMANAKAKKTSDGILWWTEKDVPTKLHILPVEDMWGLKKRALVLRNEFKCDTIRDVANLTVGQLRHRFGVWGEIIHRWSNGQDFSGMNPGTYEQPHKGVSHRITLPRDFYEREDVCVVILELLDEVCHRLRRAHQVGRRVGLEVTYERLTGGFFKAKTLPRHTDDPKELYQVLLDLFDRHWDKTGVRAIAVSVDMLEIKESIQLSLFDDVPKAKELYRTIDNIRDRYGETSDRMPVILTPDAEAVWLDTSVNDVDFLTALLRPYDAHKMYCYRVSNMIGKRGVDAPECIHAV